MREIKFRAWDKNRSVMIQSVELQKIKPTKEYWDWSVNGIFETHSDWLVWMQYIGLRDKNGVEIYEGDVVEWDDGHWNGCNSAQNPIDWANHSIQPGCAEHNHFREQVRFEDGQFTPVCWADDDESTRPPLAQCEVIGNIYENPELLEGE